jgi:hypothetical protein
MVEHVGLGGLTNDWSLRSPLSSGEVEVLHRNRHAIDQFICLCIFVGLLQLRLPLLGDWLGG